MTLGDLIYSHNLDINCNYEVYDGSQNTWNDGGKLLLKGDGDYMPKPSAELLDKDVIYITLSKCKLIIEVV